MDLDLEHGGFPLQRVDLVVLRERDVDVLLVAGLHADQLVFEAGDEAAIAEHQRVALGRTALERLAVDLADEVDHDRIALDRQRVVALRLIRLVGLRDALQRLGHLLFFRLGSQALELHAGHVGRFELRHDVDVHVVFEVRLARDDLLFIGVHVDVRLRRRTQGLVLQRLRRRRADEVLNDLGHQRFAEHLLDVRGRHLAFAEAFQVHLRLDLGDPRRQLVGQIRLGDQNLELAR